MDQQDKAWLLSKSIPLSQVFDASGMKRKDYGAAMRLAGKYVAINVTPCKRAGHRIRTRTGKCMVCDIKQYTYSQRYGKAGFVYLAASRQSGLVKVGMSTNLENRLRSLRHREYGGVSDWTLVASIELDAAGKHEAKVQAELQAYQALGYYFDGDHKQRCYELFKCELSTAIDAFRRVIDDDRLELHAEIKNVAIIPKGRSKTQSVKGSAANQNGIRSTASELRNSLPAPAQSHSRKAVNADARIGGSPNKESVKGVPRFWSVVRSWASLFGFVLGVGILVLVAVMGAIGLLLSWVSY